MVIIFLDLGCHLYKLYCTGSEQWATLCDALAARLALAGMAHAAVLTYICAANVDAAVAHWGKSAAGPDVGIASLQDVIEKAVVFGMATNNKNASAVLSELVTSYASMLASQGRMTTAMEYLVREGVTMWRNL
jgi:protein transport protein SEC31